MKKILLLFFIFSISLTSFVLADYKKPVAMESEVFQEVLSPEAELVGNNDEVISETNDIYADFEPVEFDISNFCFGGNRKPENRTIIYQINLTVDDNNLLNVESDIIPCYVYTGNLNNYQPALIEDEIEKQKVLDFMSGLTEKPF